MEGSDCGFLIPSIWVRAVRGHSSGRYWCGVAINSIMFISAHILDHLVEDGRAATVNRETLRYVDIIRSSFPDVFFRDRLRRGRQYRAPRNF